MNHVLQMREDELRLLDQILAEHVPGVDVWVYGSRAEGTARPASDLDLVLFLPAEHLARLSALREALEESSLPFRVDLHLWDDLPADIQQRIQASHVPYSPGIGTTRA